eukprot:g33057.t1
MLHNAIMVARRAGFVSALPSDEISYTRSLHIPTLPLSSQSKIHSPCWARTYQFELLVRRRQLEEAGRERRTGTRFELDGRSREFAEFVLQDTRFTCVSGLNSNSSCDISASFMLLKTGEFCRVEKGLELGGKISEGGSLCFLAVVPYKVKQAAILAPLTTPDNDEPTHEPLRWISVKDISCAAFSLLKHLADTAAISQTTRIVIPVSDF